MSGIVQAPALATPDTSAAHDEKPEMTCSPVLSVADALGVAHSMRTLVRGKKLPPGTAEIYERVAGEMISSARLSIAQSKVRK